MDYPVFDNIQEVFNRENRLVGYVFESMFFNPRSEKATYIVTDTDLLLIETDGKFQWRAPTEKQLGREIKQLMNEDTTVKSVAAKLQFEFDSDSIFHLNAYFNWSALGMGFGQMSFGRDKDTGQVVFNTEMLGKNTTRLMLHQLVDYLVDTGTSDDWDDIEARDAANKEEAQ